MWQRETFSDTNSLSDETHYCIGLDHVIYKKLSLYITCMVTYSESGVNTVLGDDASSILYSAAKETWKNRKAKLGEIITPFDDFSGIRAINISSLPKDTFMSVSFDGVGTKIEIAERSNKHDTIAFDLFAMVCDDAVVRGGEPVLVGSTLEINKINIDVIKQLAKGYVNAAKEAGVAVINGEIAEVGSRVSGFGNYNYNWSAAVIWFAKKSNMFTGKELKVGDTLISFKEDGFRSNGFSLVRKIMGDKWDKRTLSQALTPSRIYSKAVVEMFGKLNGVAHITGGGIPGKLGRTLKPSGLGAELDNLFEPCTLMQECIKLADLDLREAYKTWNMGNGMIVATTNPDEILSIARRHNIEAKICGEVVKQKGIKLTSFTGEVVSF